MYYTHIDTGGHVGSGRMSMLDDCELSFGPVESRADDSQLSSIPPVHPRLATLPMATVVRVQHVRVDQPTSLR